MTVRIIDSHHHYWSVARDDYGWLTPATGVLYQDYGPETLAPHRSRHGVIGTVLVQAAPTTDETDYLLGLADQSESILGVVGWIDLLAAEAPAVIAHYANHRKFRGVRPMLQDLPEDDWINNPALDPAMAALIAHDLRFDALVHPRHLPYLLRFAERHPALRIVIDHAAKPFIARAELDPWRDDMAALAALPNVYCKLSGLVTEAKADWTPVDLAPYVQHVIESFGSERVMWGSDWPVLLLAATYDSWITTADGLLATLPADQREDIFHRAARTFYRLP